MWRLLLIAGLMLAGPACRGNGGRAERSKARQRSGQVALLGEMVGRLEQLARRHQPVEGACRSARSQLAPLRVKTDPQSQAILIRYHRVCSREQHGTRNWRSASPR